MSYWIPQSLIRGEITTLPCDLAAPEVPPSGLTKRVDISFFTTPLIPLNLQNLP